ncbi:hypothetical protein BG023_112012 [Porphyrobacter sp. LM 6]|nr:hypothetical protein BG023_112012 [Porphyrobacter sp. LM 6]
MRAFGRGRGDDTATGTGETESSVESSAEENAAEFEASEEWLDTAEETASASRFGWLAPSLAFITVAGWTGFFGWAHQTAMLAGAAPATWATWLVQWSVPVALIGVVWLLAMRSSQAEARRFAASAALMREESAALEARLKVVNRELSLAREFLAAQSRDLEALGRIAAERISTHAAELQTLIVNNGAQVDAIGATSETALGNMNRLRDDLPVVANAARDVANQIGGAGRNAQDQLERLVAGFERLNTFGSASEKQVTRLGTQVGATLAGFEDQLGRIEALVSQRFVALQADAEAYRTQIDELENEALAALGARAQETASATEAIAERLRAASSATQEQLEASIAQVHEGLLAKLAMIDEVDRANGAAASERIATLRAEVQTFENQMAERSRALAEQIEQRQAALDTHEAQASEVLSQRLSALDDALAQRREAQIADTEKLLAQGEAIAEKIDQLGKVMIAIGEHGESARASLTAGFGTLDQQLAEKRAALQDTEARLTRLTESGIRLLEIIQSGVRSTREELPAAIAAADASLSEAEARADKVNQLMLRSSQHGTDLSEYLVQTRGEIDAAEIAIAGLKTQLASETEDALARLQGLRSGFVRLAEESGTLATQTHAQLLESLGTLEAAIDKAFATLDEGAREKAILLAERIGTEAVEALERALRNEAAATIGKLEQSAAHASGVGREAVVQLRDQLARVNELTGNLEQRVARTRELAEEQVNNDFSRRMALITESLNSAAIDITTALATEVSDTAWDAYLKGDRGIFTRRAVRLIDNGTARDIATLYGDDEDFRANVNRYIHDFEAMLRTLLSTRDGHTLSVTVLGSEIGKLYVALAQAIQRLR